MFDKPNTKRLNIFLLIMFPDYEVIVNMYVYICKHALIVFLTVDLVEKCLKESLGLSKHCIMNETGPNRPK